MRRMAFLLSLVLIFMIPWEGVIDVPGLGTATKMMGLGVAAVWIVTVVASGRFRKPGPFHFAAYMFMLWSALSIFWSGDTDRTMSQLLTWVQLLGFVFVLWDLYTTRAALLAGLQVYVLGTYVAIGSTVASFLTGSAFYTNYQRFSPGSEMNPDGFGFILALGIPAAWYLVSSESTGRLGPLFRLVNLAYMPAAFLGIALSGTRTAAIAAIPAMGYGIWSLMRLKPGVRVAIMAILIIAIILLLPMVEPLKSFQRLGTTGSELTTGDLTGRLLVWRDGLASFEEHPVLGVGANMYRTINSLGKVAHNSFLSVLVELGLVGFGLFALVLVIAVTQAWRQPRWDSVFWLCLLLVWAIGASALTWEHRKSTWLFLSLLMVSAALARQDEQARPLVQHDGPAGQLVQQTG